MLKERTEKKRGVAGRISPRDVLEAYKVTGWEPTRNEYIDNEGGSVIACGMFAYAGMLRPDAGTLYFVLESTLKMNFSGPYLDGFALGFDEFKIRYYADHMPEAAKGWRDGRRAARFVFGDSDA